MSNIIAASIHQLLVKHGSVYIPAIGQFNFQHFSAHLDNDSEVIAPPYGKLVFSPTTKESSTLEKHVAKLGGFDQERAKELVLAYSNKVSKRLLKKKQAAIDGLGILQIGKSGRIELDDRTAYYNKTAYGLRKLNLSEIDYSVLEKPASLIQHEAVTSMPARTDNSQTFWRWFKIFLAALLLFLLLLSVRSCGKFLTSSDGSLPVGEEIGLIEGTNTEENSPSLLEETTNDASSTENEKLSSNTETDLAVKSAAFIPADGCIIIVGVYKNNRNVVRMQDQLAASGYTVYTEISPDGLTRVGFKFDCEGVDLVNYIRAVRKTIHKNAWYLQPQMEVY